MTDTATLYDTPPVGTQGRMRDFAPLDEVVEILIQNPGKWSLLTTQTHRGLQALKIRYGSGVRFTTRKDKQSGLVEVWAAYHPTSNRKP